MTSFVYNKRNTKTISEANLWEFAEFKLSYNNLDVTEGKLRWEIFDHDFAAALKDTLDLKTNEKFAKSGFFNIEFHQVGSTAHGTAISKSDFDICAVLNAKCPLESSASDQNEYKLVRGNEVLTQKDLLVIANLCKNEIKTQAAQEGVAVEIKEPKDFKQLQYYTLTIDGYDYDVLLALKCIGNKFLAVWTSPDAQNVTLTESKALGTANTIELMNKTYIGFVEIIRVCKLLLTQWNSGADHERRIKPCTFESITYSVARAMNSSIWNSATFKDLLTKIWTVFSTQIELDQGFVASLNNSKENLLEFFPRKSAQSKAANEWIQKFLAKTDEELLQELNNILNKLKDNKVQNENQSTSNSN